MPLGIIELLELLNDSDVEADLFEEGSRRSRSLQERETPFWRVMMPVLITVVLLLGAFAFVAWLLSDAGLISLGGHL